MDMIIDRSLMPLNYLRTMGSVRRRDDNSRGKVQNVRGDSSEEIRGDHLPDVIRQERAPRLGWRAPRADHVFRDGRLTDVNA
jgi:hypothetical protein